MQSQQLEQKEQPPFQQIIEAAEKQDELLLTQALCSASINIKEPRTGMTPIAELAARGRHEAVAFLHKKGASAAYAMYGYAKGGYKKEADAYYELAKHSNNLKDTKFLLIEGFAAGGNKTEVNYLLEVFKKEYESWFLGFQVAAKGYALGKHLVLLSEFLDGLEQEEDLPVLLGLVYGTLAETYATLGDLNVAYTFIEKRKQLKHYPVCWPGEIARGVAASGIERNIAEVLLNEDYVDDAMLEEMITAVGNSSDFTVINNLLTRFIESAEPDLTPDTAHCSIALSIAETGNIKILNAFLEQIIRADEEFMLALMKDIIEGLYYGHHKDVLYNFLEIIELRFPVCLSSCLNYAAKQFTEDANDQMTDKFLARFKKPEQQDEIYLGILAGTEQRIEKRAAALDKIFNEHLYLFDKVVNILFEDDVWSLPTHRLLFERIRKKCPDKEVGLVRHLMVDNHYRIFEEELLQSMTLMESDQDRNALARAIKQNWDNPEHDYNSWENPELDYNPLEIARKAKAQKSVMTQYQLENYNEFLAWNHPQTRWLMTQGVRQLNKGTIPTEIVGNIASFFHKTPLRNPRIFSNKLIRSLSPVQNAASVSEEKSSKRQRTHGK